MEKLKLNENDKKLLIYCNDLKRTITEVAKHLNIAPKNVSVRLEKLEQAGLIKVEKKGVGKKTLIRSIDGDKTNKHYLTLLREIKKRGGVTDEEYVKILHYEGVLKEKDKFSALMTLPLLTPKLVFKKIFITLEGEKFLKEHSK